MSQEFYYTSAPRGLLPGTQGFCIVAATKGMSSALMEKLEALTGYKPLFPPNDPKASLNPVAYLHLVLTSGGERLHVVGRVGASGLDYTGRTNKFAHLVVLAEDELPSAGPAWLLQQPGFLKESWQGTPRYLETSPHIPRGKTNPGVCRKWQEITGDAGWGGALAEAFLSNVEQPVYLIFKPGQATLPLLAESLALMPPQERWNVGFSTYHMNLPTGLECHWRCTPAESAEAKTAHRSSPGWTWILAPELGKAKGGVLVEAARTGERSSSPKRKKDAFPVATKPALEPAENVVADKRKRLRLDDLAEAEGRDGEERSTRAREPAVAAGRSGLIFFGGLFLGLLFMAGTLLGLEMALKSSVAESIGIASTTHPPALHEAITENTGERAKELKGDVADVEKRDKQIGELLSTKSVLEARCDKAENQAQTATSEKDRVVTDLNVEKGRVSKITAENEEKDREIGEQKRKISDLESKLADFGKKDQPLLPPKSKVPERDPRVAVFCDLIPDFQKNPNEKDPNPPKMSGDIRDLLGISKSEKFQIVLDFERLAKVARKDPNTDGVPLSSEWDAAKNVLFVKFGKDNPKPIAQFKIEKDQLHFKWHEYASESEDLPDARDQVKRSVLLVKVGDRKYFLHFLAPVKLELVAGLASQNQEHKDKKDKKDKEATTIQYHNVYRVEKLASSLMSAPMQTLHLLDGAVVNVGKRSYELKSQDQGKTLTYNQSLDDSKLDKKNGYLDIKLSIDAQRMIVLVIRQYGRETVRHRPPEPEEPKEPKDKGKHAEFQKAKNEYKKAKEAYDKTKPDHPELFKPLPILDKLQVVSEITGGSRLPLVVTGK